MSPEFLTLQELQTLPNLTQVEIAWIGEMTFSKYWIARRDEGQVWTTWRGKWMQQITKTGVKFWEVRVRELENPQSLDPVWEPSDVDYTEVPVPKPKKPVDPPPTKTNKKEKKKPHRKIPTPGVLELVEQTDLSEVMFAPYQTHPLKTDRWHIIFSVKTSYCWKQLAMDHAKSVDKIPSQKYICIGCLRKLNRKQSGSK